MNETISPRLMAATASIGLHAALLALVWGHTLRTPKPTPEPEFVVTVDALGTAVTPAGAALPPPAAVAPMPPDAMPQAAKTPAAPEVNAAQPEPASAPPEVSSAVLANAGTAMPAAPEAFEEAASGAVAAAAPAEYAAAAAEAKVAPPAAVPPVPGDKATAPLAVATGPAVLAAAPPSVGSAPAAAAPDAAPLSESAEALSSAITPSAVGLQPTLAEPNPVATAAPGSLGTEAPPPASPISDAESARPIDAPPVGTSAGTADIAPQDGEAVHPPAAAVAASEVTTPVSQPGLLAATTPPPSTGVAPPTAGLPGSTVPELANAPGQVLAESEPAPTDAPATEAPISPLPSTALEAQPNQPAPVAPAPPSPTQTAKLETGPSIAAIHALVDNYDGGPCFYASVAHASENGVAVDAFSADTSKFGQLDQAIKGALKIESDIVGQRVWSSQCSAIDFLSKSADSGLQLTLARHRIRAGETLTGSVIAKADDQIILIAVDELGHVRNETDSLRLVNGYGTFAIRFQENRPGGPYPHILMAIADPDPVPGSWSSNLTAQTFFASLNGSRTRNSQAHGAAQLVLMSP